MIYYFGLKKNVDKLLLIKKFFVWSLIINSKDILCSVFVFMRKKIIFKYDIINLNLCI